MVQAEEGGPKYFPDPLDKMLGLSVALKCKYQAKFHSSFVMKMLDDPAIIQAIASQIGCQQEDAKEITKPISDNTGVVKAARSQEDNLQCKSQIMIQNKI